MAATAKYVIANAVESSTGELFTSTEAQKISRAIYSLTFFKFVSCYKLYRSDPHPRGVFMFGQFERPAVSFTVPIIPRGGGRTMCFFKMAPSCFEASR